jgi:hypothetical protein
MAGLRGSLISVTSIYHQCRPKEASLMRLTSMTPTSKVASNIYQFGISSDGIGGEASNKASNFGSCWALHPKDTRAAQSCVVPLGHDGRSRGSWTHECRESPWRMMKGDTCPAKAFFDRALLRRRRMPVVLLKASDVNRPRVSPAEVSFESCCKSVGCAEGGGIEPSHFSDNNGGVKLFWDAFGLF